MSPTSASTLPALGAIAVLSLSLTACGMLGNTTASRPQVTLNVADAAMASGAPDLALRVADMVLAKHPDSAAALTARGDALYAMGQAELAGQAYRAAVKSDPKFAGAQIGLGRTVIRTDPKAAEAAFLAAATLQPDNTVALSNLGVARDLQKHHAAAQEAYRAALAVDPDMSDARVNLGLSLALSGQAEAAVQILQPLARQPGATQVWHADLAVALAQAGDLAGARRAIAMPIQVASEPDATPAPESAALAASDAPAASPSAPVVTASSEQPVAVPAPRTAVNQHDMAAPKVARVDPAPAVQVAQTEAPPAPTPAPIVPDRLLAAMVTAVPVAAAETASPAASAPPPAAAAPDQPRIVLANLPAPAVARLDDVPASPPVQVTPVAANPLPVPAPAIPAIAPAVAAIAAPAIAAPAPAPMVVAAAAVPSPALAAVHQASVPDVAAAAPPVASHQGWTPWLQLAAVRSEQDVQQEWHRLQTHLPDLLDGHSLTVSQGDAHDHTYWRLRTGGFASLADANALCMRIRMVGGKCFAVITGGI